MTLRGRMKYNAKANRVISRAILCKMFKCTPKQLDEMDWDEVEYFETVYSEVAKKNPLALLM